MKGIITHLVCERLAQHVHVEGACEVGIKIYWLACRASRLTNAFCYSQTAQYSACQDIKRTWYVSGWPSMCL